MDLFFKGLWPLLAFATYFAQGNPQLNTTLNPIFEWNLLDFAAPNTKAIYYKGYSIHDPKGTYISGMDDWGDRFFLSTPSVLTVVRATLSSVSKQSGLQNKSPILQPYPNLDWHNVSWNKDGKFYCHCETTLVSVFRTARDRCNRLWVLDSASLFNGLPQAQIICQPKIVIFDMATDQVVRTVTIPNTVLKSKSLVVNIILDEDNGETSNDSCDGMFVYIADSGVPSAIIVYDSARGSFYRISHPSMSPLRAYEYVVIDGEPVKALDGITAMTISGSGPQRRLIYSPFSAVTVYSILTSTLQQGPVKNPSALSVKTEFIEPSQSLVLYNSMVDGCIIFNPISSNSLFEVNNATSKPRPIIFDKQLIKVVHHIQSDSRDSNVLYAVISRTQDFFNYHVNVNKINLWVVSFMHK